jgi:tellurite resistance protein TerC
VAGEIKVRSVRKIFIGIVGGTVLLLGIAMILLPGPAILVIPAGLAILATEFAWAERWLQKARSKIVAFKARRSAKKASRQVPATR